ncbi:MAG: methylmalonyl-CoA mutase family protein [Pseudomonadota bacterium]
MNAPLSAVDNRQSAVDRPPVRFVTAASLFDGHDAAINIMRRLLLAKGAEVVHLGHNRSVEEVVRAAVQEDAAGIACSSYQGGHVEYFKYMVDRLAHYGAQHIRVFAGGGGTISPEEIRDLEAYGVTRVYSPNDGLRLGLEGMIDDVIERAGEVNRPGLAGEQNRSLRAEDHTAIARAISALEEGQTDLSSLVSRPGEHARPPVIGITGTGGAGKSSLLDELLQRILATFPEYRVGVLAVDPTRRRTGGALLGDRIRMNSLASDRIFMRSLATRRQHLATAEVLGDCINLLTHTGFDLVVVETAGIGQSDTQIVDLVDLSLYVMTVDFGAPSQLEKIDMLDFADLIVLNKFERRGSEDALREIRKQWRRNRVRFDVPDEEVPVYPAIASRFNDAGVNRLFAALCGALGESSEARGLRGGAAAWSADGKQNAPGAVSTEVPAGSNEPLVPAARERYLAEIVASGRDVRATIDAAADAASRAYACFGALQALLPDGAPLPAFETLGEAQLAALDIPAAVRDGVDALVARYNEALERIGAEGLGLLREWPARADAARSERYAYQVRGRTIEGDNYTQSLSGLSLPKIAVPDRRDWGDLLRFLMEENLPGAYPYTAGVYPYRREAEDPTRMFAGEGTPERTNRRFHYLAAGQSTTRLSTAFDSVTLYGEDPATRPDIYGKIGNAGVSIATLDDMKKLYSGFDLCAPTTSVSMTINGPAPVLMAMFLNTAIDQQVERYLREQGQLDQVRKDLAVSGAVYQGDLPGTHDGLGLGLLGTHGAAVVEPEVYAKIRDDALRAVRGTVQADILKEDQAQNTCIFSTEFAMRLMGDVQEYFSHNGVRNFYSVSVSGYHIAEAGANPISQLAFTLANGFTIVEYYLSRGLPIDSFAPNLSFFFSNGMDPEYAVIGRVARRIWARAMRERYGASPRSQMLKYHIQTSGRSLHAQEIQFNDIRTTLQAMYALFDSCNSLHTNAFDEALTTPTEDSVRRAMAIQLIINRELGINQNQNPWQGSFVIEELTRAVEDAVYAEFERLAERGGVLGAMETMYQRGRIQDESMLYEARKHDGSLPIIGVNTFLKEGGEASEEEQTENELIRSSEEEKRQQVAAVEAFVANGRDPGAEALAALQGAARTGDNLFDHLMVAVRHCSLGTISDALYRVGGRYRRNL